MKIAVSSDWHGNIPRKSDRKIITNCDLLLLAGDVFGKSILPVAKFLKEITDLNIPVIMTPGNHDFSIYNSWLSEIPDYDYRRKLLRHIPTRLDYGTAPAISKSVLKEQFGIDVLIDESIECKGLTIYGCPWSTEFCRWAFMLDEKDLHEVYEKIPNNLDILLCHTPPQIPNCRIDMVENEPFRHCGSYSLGKIIPEKAPKYFFCGHIHSGAHDGFSFGKTTYRNVSYLNEEYKPAYPIFTMEV